MTTNMAFSLMTVFLVTIHSLCAASEVKEATDTVACKLSQNQTISPKPLNIPQEVGEYYEVMVPDTLDLAENARLGINHFTESIRKELNYEMIMGVNFQSDSINVSMHMSGLACCQAKCMEAMAMERIMSGSKQNMDREANMLEMMASNVGEEGIWWVPKITNEPWMGPEEFMPYANTHGEGRMLRAMMSWYQYTGDERWKTIIDRMVDGLDKVFVVHKDDYAYVPTAGWMPEEYFRSCYVKGPGWKDTTEPENEKAGEEGSLFNHQANIAGPLATWYALTGNEQALRLSGELVRFLIKPKFWADFQGGCYPGVIGAEHAEWQGHFHGYANALRSILDYAIVTNDERLKSFVRDGYEWCRVAQGAIPSIGKVGDTQGCGVGRFIGLAVKMSLCGIGDYWEDVDQSIRNHAAAYQITAKDVLKKIGKADISMDEYAMPDDVIRIVGEQNLPATGGLPGIKAADVIRAAIGEIPGNPDKNASWQCCSGHGNMAFFYAWDGALRYNEGTVQVNLLINRASPWMDVDSYLPYEGKVVLRNKLSQEAFVRIPIWVDRESVKCLVGDKDADCRWFGNYLHFQNLNPGDTLNINFQMRERTENWTIGDIAHTIQFRGNTLISISPSAFSGLYSDRAEKYAGKISPMRKLMRYTTSQSLRW